MSGKNGPQGGLTRRGFLKTTGAVAGTMAVGGVASSGLRTAHADDGQADNAEEELYSCICRANCMGACRLMAHVRDGKLVKLTPGEYADDGYRGSCLRGISYMHRIYSPTRVKYPMRRTGERGAGQWERISWDEAIDEIAGKIKSAVDEFGPKSVIFSGGSGSWGTIHGTDGIYMRLCCCLGATSASWCYDRAAGHGVGRVCGTGDWAYPNEPNSVLDASLIIIWGTNPALTAPQTWRWMQRAKENGTNILCLDPIKSATAHRANEWKRVNAGHDGYLALALCNYVVQHDLADWDFIKNKTTASFLVRQDTKKHLRKSDYAEVTMDPETGAVLDDDFYVWDTASNKAVLVGEAVDPALEGSFVTKDGVKVDTAFSLLKAELAQYSVSEASRLTGLEEAYIEELAQRIATERSVSVSLTYGIDHYTNGYLTTWSIATLLALTGNFAKPGAGLCGVFCSDYTSNVAGLWVSEEFAALNDNIPNGKLGELFSTQQLEGNPYPAKVLIHYAHNAMSNEGNQNVYFEQIIPNVDYWVVVDMEFTDTARYADLVLPCSSWYEIDEVRTNYCNPYTVLQEKAVDPLYESKSDCDIVCELGRALGFEKSFPKEADFDYWANILFSDEESQKLGISLERLRKEKYIQSTGKKGDRFVRGLSNDFPTESKRLQLYVETPRPRLDYGQDLSEREPGEHIVYYRPPEESGIDSELKEKYPLVYLQEHARYRTHSQWFNVKMMRELDPEPLAKVNSVDAQARGVSSGDIVEVFNDRGHCVLKCLVDESIASGVVSIPKGWQREQFIEGGYQELTHSKMDPYSLSYCYYDNRVDFRKWEG